LLYTHFSLSELRVPPTSLDLDDRGSRPFNNLKEQKIRLARKDIFRKLFELVVRQSMDKGLIEGRLILTDSTHVKANA